VTRFGWKAQNKSLHIFAGETPGRVFTGSHEDLIDTMTQLDDATLFAGFMRFLPYTNAADGSPVRCRRCTATSPAVALGAC